MKNEQQQLDFGDFKWTPEIVKLYNHAHNTNFSTTKDLLEYLYIHDSRTRFDGHRVATLLNKTSYWFYKQAKKYDIKMQHAPRQARKMLLFLGIPKDIRSKLSSSEISEMISCSSAYSDMLVKMFNELPKDKLIEQIKYIRLTCPKDFINEVI